MDGTTVQTHTESSTPEPSYSQQTVDLSAYANGASHTISFSYSANNSSSHQRMLIDDVSLTTPSAVTATPTVTSTIPGFAQPQHDSEGAGHRRGRLDGDALLRQHLHQRAAGHRDGGGLRGRRDHRDGAGERDDHDLREGDQERPAGLGLLVDLGLLHQ